MTLREFLHDVFASADASSICGVPTLRRFTASAVNLRIPIVSGKFIDVFFNEETGRTAYALIKDTKRLFGADNTGGWHLHPFDAPDEHHSLDHPMTFDAFLALIEEGPGQAAPQK